MESSILILVFLLLEVHYVLFIYKIYLGLVELSLSKKSSNPRDYFVTVIIPFRNESENILNSLTSLVNQDYPADRFEVIYVDDSSDDDSYSKLSTVVKPGNFKILSIDNSQIDRAFKKRTISYAIDNSVGDIILTTDADCVYEAGWITSMVALFDDSTGMVAGPVEFHEADTLFNKIQQLEFRGLILAGAGLIGSGNPVTCSAANLAYRKDVFYEAGGFDDNLNLTSGDDELLMQKIYNTGKYKIKFCADKNALVKTNLNKSLDEFFNQRKRWASKSLFYKDRLLILRLVLVFLFYLGIPVLGVLSLMSAVYIKVLLLTVFGKIITEYFVMKSGEMLIFKTKLLKYLPAAEIFQVVYIIIAAFTGIWGNLKWKGRVVKR